MSPVSLIPPDFEVRHSYLNLVPEIIYELRYRCIRRLKL